MPRRLFQFQKKTEFTLLEEGINFTTVKHEFIFWQEGKLFCVASSRKRAPTSGRWIRKLFGDSLHPGNNKLILDAFFAAFPDGRAREEAPNQPRRPTFENRDRRLAPLTRKGRKAQDGKLKINQNTWRDYSLGRQVVKQVLLNVF